MYGTMERKPKKYAIDLSQLTVSRSENLQEYKRQYGKLYYATADHRQKRRQREKQYRQKHAEKLKFKLEEWRRKHPRYGGLKYRKEHNLIVTRLGGKCQKCGFTDRRALQIDHVNNDGDQERKNFSSTEIIARLLKLDETTLHTNYQVLCANCNWIKKYEIHELRWLTKEKSGLSLTTK